MTLPGRRLKKYHPRRSKKVLALKKQEFLDCLHTLDMFAGQLIIMCKEGSVAEIQQTQVKAKSAYNKYKDQLLELASNIQESVKDRALIYLNDLETLILSALTYDEGVFNSYFTSLMKIKAISVLKSKVQSQEMGNQKQNRSA